MKKALLAMLVLTSFVSAAHAAGGSDPNIGCGLGTELFAGKLDKKVFALLGATTNGTYTQTFGISSGTSNCDGSAAGSEGAKAFVETNRAALAKDIARGRGETIESLTELAGCRDARSVGKKLQKSFKVIFPNAKVSNREVSASVVKVLRRETKLSCENLGA